jgi:hypothetical protein
MPETAITEQHLLLLRTEVNWCHDILKRILETVQDTDPDPNARIYAIGWLAKQGLKGLRIEE